MTPKNFTRPRLNKSQNVLRIIENEIERRQKIHKNIRVWSILSLSGDKQNNFYIKI